MTCRHRLWGDVTTVTCTRELGHAGEHVYAGSRGWFQAYQHAEHHPVWPQS